MLCQDLAHEWRWSVSSEYPDRFLSPDGSVGWYAYNPDGSRIGGDDDPWEPPREGSTIRLMGEHCVEIPLWGEDGLLFSGAEELVEHWDLSADLVSDLREWADAWLDHSEEPSHDDAAVRLVRRLADELDHRYDIVFKP